MLNLDLDQRKKILKLKNQVFQSLHGKNKFFNPKSWFFCQESGNHILMLLTLIQRSTKKNEEEKGDNVQRIIVSQ